MTLILQQAQCVSFIAVVGKYQTTGEAQVEPVQQDDCHSYLTQLLY